MVDWLIGWLYNWCTETVRDTINTNELTSIGNTKKNCSRMRISTDLWEGAALLAQRLLPCGIVSFPETSSVSSSNCAWRKGRSCQRRCPTRTWSGLSCSPPTSQATLLCKLRQFSHIFYYGIIHWEHEIKYISCNTEDTPWWRDKFYNYTTSKRTSSIWPPWPLLSKSHYRNLNSKICG